MTHHDDARLDDLVARMADGDSKDLFRSLLQQGMQDLIDSELTAMIGAELHENTSSSESPTSTPSTSRLPSAVTEVATTTARETMRWLWRALM